MELKVKNNCPLNGFEPCKELDCAWFTQIRGTDPNSGEEKSDYGCAVAWMPILTLEGAAMSRQTGAAVESFRNEMVKSNELSRALLITTDKNLIEG